MRLQHRFLLTLIFAGFIFLPAANAAESLAVTAPDLVAPTIEHEMILESVAHGQPVEIHARVSDNVAVKQVELFYRATGAEAYQRILMQPAQTPDMYTVTLDSAYPGIEYYIQASDTAGNTLLRGHTLYPLSVRVMPEGEEPPTQTADGANNTSDKPKKKKKTWLWVGAGIGALVIIGLAAGGSGGGGGGDPSSSVDVSGPVP